MSTKTKHHHPLSYIAGMLVALGLCYLMASLAINSGSLLEYALTLFLFITALALLKDSLKALWTKK